MIVKELQGIEKIQLNDSKLMVVQRTFLRYNRKLLLKQYENCHNLYKICYTFSVL